MSNVDNLLFVHMNNLLFRKKGNGGVHTFRRHLMCRTLIAVHLVPIYSYIY
jgi:hypothetical protein